MQGGDSAVTAGSYPVQLTPWLRLSRHMGLDPVQMTVQNCLTLLVLQFPMTVLVTWDCVVRHATPWPVVDNWLSKVGSSAELSCMGAGLEISPGCFSCAACMVETCLQSLAIQ